jgi:choline-sulfatase
MRQEWAHLTPLEWRQIIAAYYGMVALVDLYVGRVLEAVDRLGIAGETAVIWHSDHGDQAGEHGMMLKFNMREGSVRVPLMMRVPGLAPGVRDEPVEAIDLFPTICDLLGVAVPETVQGRSLAPLLRGQRPPDWRTACFSQIGDVEMIRTPQWKLNLYGGEPGELFQLDGDPNEFRNVIDSPEHEAVRGDLLARLEAWRERNRPALDASGALALPG